MADEARLNRLRSSRQVYRDKIERLLTEVNRQYTTRDTTLPDRAELTVINNKMHNFAEAIVKLDTDIGVLITDDTEYAQETVETVELQESIWDAEGRISLLLETGAGSQVLNGGSHANGSDELRSVAGSHAYASQEVKLPKLQMPTFTGEPLDWQEYWDQFKSSIHDKDMAEIDKFKYLKQTLGGDAAKMVNGFRLTEANYRAVIELLIERFGNKEVAVFAHFEQLLALPPANGNTGHLTTTYDECERHVRSLVALGLSEDTFGQVFTPIILSKLPRGLRVELHRRNGSEPWKLTRLRELFKEELKARQMGDWSLQRDSKGGNPKNSQHNNQNQNKKSLPPTNTFMQGSRQEPKIQKPGQKGTSMGQGSITCTFCKGQHFSDQCTKYKSPDERKAIATRNGHCFKCLSAKHLARNCQKTTKCYYCSDATHHRSLCNKRFKQNGQPQQADSFTTNTQIPIIQPNPGAGGMTGTGEATQPGGTQFFLTNTTGTQGPTQFTGGSMYQPQGGNTGPTLNPNAGTFVSGNGVTYAAAADGCSVHMQMAHVTFTVRGKRIGARIFFDPGSSNTYITTAMANQLGLKPHGTTVVSNARFGEQTRVIRSYNAVSLPIPTRNGNPIVVEAFVTDVIAPAFQKLPLSSDQYPILNQLPLADWISERAESVPIDILIGEDHYYDFVTSEQIRLPGGLILLGSRLGYLTAGKVQQTCPRQTSTFPVASFLNFSDRGPRVHNSDIEQFWRLEDIGVKDDSYQKDDDYAVQQFEKSVRKMDDGRYEAGWPWREKSPVLPDNYGLAASRLRTLLRKLQQNPEFFQAYDGILKGQLDAGIIELVEKPKPVRNALVHYLPHHAVLKPSSATTKVRIVHDASAKASKTSFSLNDCLLRGPVFLSDLCGLLLKFRFHSVAFVCDIEKAFFQVGLRPPDRDVTRFLWVKNPNKPPDGDNLLTYRFTKVPFGVVSSPFLLGATIKHHLAQSDSPVAKAIAGNLYVDNLLCGGESVEQARAFFAESIRLFSEIRMNLREWFTNSSDFRESIPMCSLGKGMQTKVLGMSWDTVTDSLSFPESDAPSMRVRTKRHLLQAVSSVYDPCGLLSPMLVQGKLLVQETWRRELKWDDPLPVDLSTAWQRLVDQFSDIHTMNIPRFVCGTGTGIHLHCFSDASAKAYAAAVYSVTQDAGVPQLLFSKAKLAPIKPVTLPRLELMAILIGTRLLKFAKNQLTVPVVGLTLWSDSKCALQWIHSGKVLSVFVGNRVREISQLQCDFRYVPTDLNPADLPSRGVSLGDLKQSTLWWRGPDFLSQPVGVWPPNDLKFAPKPLESETYQPIITMIQESKTAHSGHGPFGIEAKRFSSLSKLLRVTCLVQRFCGILKRRVKHSSAPLDMGTTSPIRPTASELSNARHLWISYLQKKVLVKNTNFKNLKRQLELFQDDSGIWRCGGRLRHAQLTDDSKFTVLLPKGDHFTGLVIKHAHEQVHHSGPAHTLAELRAGYWVPCGRSQVQSIIHRCPTCRLWEGGPYKAPKYPPLPSVRVTRLIPFECTGIDYLGPLIVKEDSHPKKVWICLFTCSSTRAIHLELVHALTTDQFLLSFRRFVALYGKPRTVISDNGKYFKQASNILAKLWSEITASSSVTEYLSGREIEWKFIPEFSPWMGGFYERLVGSVKRSLRKVLNRARLTATQLATVVAEISAVLNTRPIIASSDVRDQILTPADLLGKQRRVGIPIAPCDSTLSSDQSYFPSLTRRDQLLEGWKQNEMVLQQFWDSWTSEYLTSLREGHRAEVNPKGAQDEVPSVGSLVLIKDNNQPRSIWKVGVISRLTESFDGICRSAVVRLSDGRSLVRPIKLLFPLELERAHATSEGSVQGPGTCPDPHADGNLRQSASKTDPQADGNLRYSASHTDTQAGGNVHHSASQADGNLRHSASHTDTPADGNLHHSASQADGNLRQSASETDAHADGNLRQSASNTDAHADGNLRHSAAARAQRPKRKAAEVAFARIQSQMLDLSDDE